MVLEVREAGVAPSHLECMARHWWVHSSLGGSNHDAEDVVSGPPGAALGRDVISNSRQTSSDIWNELESSF